MLLILTMAPAGRSWAQAVPEIGGTVEALLGDRVVNFPSLRSDYQVEIEGDLVTVTLIQIFANPSEQPVNATYLFPLPTKAAVYKMEMEVGDERINARIQRAEEAQAAYDKAKQEGRAAALLTEHRPNMFTQEIANLMPGLPVKVTISYVHVATRVDGHYELVVPLVVGPRYQPTGRGEKNSETAGLKNGEPAAGLSRKAEYRQPEAVEISPPTSRNESRQAALDSRKKYGEWELESLPAYPPVSGLTAPKAIDADRVGLTVNIKAGQPISQLTSSSHSLTEKRISDRQASLALAEGRTIDNRDFILSWSLSGEKTQAGLLAHKDDRGGFFSLLIEPPAAPGKADLIPREMVFVLDTSGSMKGAPLAACQKFMHRALKSLRPGDYFRIVTFDNAAREFGDGAISASPENIQQGLTYVSRLRASGGTEAASGIRQALDVPQKPGTLRLVVFMTDGYIGNEIQVLSLINSHIGQARILTFGVGTSVNRYLLEEAALEGRGWSQILDPTADVDETVAGLAGRLEFPVLTDIAIDWGGEVSWTAPDPIPDLFAGQAIRVMGRYKEGGTREVTVAGLTGGGRSSLHLKIDLPETSSPDPQQAIPLIWARESIADLQRQFNAPTQLRKSKLADDDLKELITTMGLTYNLVTPWTSFVAASEKVVNNGAPASDAKVPLPQVKGTQPSAYGINSHQPATVSGPTFRGGGVPEPATMSGLALLGATGWLALRRRKLNSASSGRQ